MFNGSSSSYLICYHSPSYIINKYGFDVELVVQAPTSMHGSKEGHMGYIYKRKQKRRKRENHCDALFKNAWATVQDGLQMLAQHIESRMQETSNGGRITRSTGVKHTAVSRIEEGEEEAKKAEAAKKMQETSNGSRMTSSRGTKHTAVSKIEGKGAKKAKTKKKR